MVKNTKIEMICHLKNKKNFHFSFSSELHVFEEQNFSMLVYTKQVKVA